MADISYTPTTWADGSEGGTPIDATKLNNIEQGIVDAVGAIGPNDTTADGTLKAQIDALGESVTQLISNGVVDDLNDISTYLCKTAQNAQNMPSLNSNTCFVITLIPDKNATYNAQVAFSFGSYKIAMRTRQAHVSGGAWGAWKYATLS